MKRHMSKQIGMDATLKVLVKVNMFGVLFSIYSRLEHLKTS